MKKDLKEAISWLEKILGNHSFQISPLRQEASDRSYFRITLKNDSYVLMNNFGSKENAANFIKIQKILKDEKVNVPNIFGFSDQDFERICYSKLNNYMDPYQTLGVSKDTQLEEIKNRWKTLAMKHHPDRLIAQGMPQDIIENNTYRLKEINNAWDLIKNKKYDLNA